MDRRTSFSRLVALTLTPLILAAFKPALAQRPSLPGYRPLPGRPAGRCSPGVSTGG